MSRPMPPNRGTSSPGGSDGGDLSSSVVPTLRVMRLQSPELHEPASSLFHSGSCSIHNSLCLPDSLQVLVGETFTAYLGVLNVSRSVAIRRLSVQAHLQTPSHRWLLTSPLSEGGVDVPVGSLVDAIVSHGIEESGQHILRVEVSYAGDGGTKTFRKFYRFQVVNPLTISTMAVRMGDAACIVQVAVEYNPEASVAGEDEDSIVISHADFIPAPGLLAERIGRTSFVNVDPPQSATDLLDASGLLVPKQTRMYLFQVSVETGRGLAAGDKLGSALFTWRKSMGETGRVGSSPILVPAVLPRFTASANTAEFVVYKSGLSVDVAAAADRRTTPHQKLPLPVTVEPLQPPARMLLNRPLPVDLYIVNHDDRPMTLQLQFRLAYMTEIAVCGPSFISLGQLEGRGASTVTTIRIVPLATGLLTLQGCWVVDLASDQEIPQPPLFHVYCVLPDDDETNAELTPSHSRLVQYVTKDNADEEEQQLPADYSSALEQPELEVVEEDARHRKVWERAHLPKSEDVFEEEVS